MRAYITRSICQCADSTHLKHSQYLSLTVELETHIVTPLCQFACSCTRQMVHSLRPVYMCECVCADETGLTLYWIGWHCHCSSRCTFISFLTVCCAKCHLKHWHRNDCREEQHEIEWPTRELCHFHGMAWNTYILNGLVNDKEMNNKYEKPFSNHSRIVWELRNKKTHTTFILDSRKK